MLNLRNQAYLGFISTKFYGELREDVYTQNATDGSSYKFIFRDFFSFLMSFLSFQLTLSIPEILEDNVVFTVNLIARDRNNATVVTSYSLADITVVAGRVDSPAVYYNTIHGLLDMLPTMIGGTNINAYFDELVLEIKPKIAAQPFKILADNEKTFFNLGFLGGGLTENLFSYVDPDSVGNTLYCNLFDLFDNDAAWPLPSGESEKLET